MHSLMTFPHHHHLIPPHSSCIPGNLFTRGTKIQLLDLPGILEGASEGRGRGRQVVAVAKASDLVLIVLDAQKEGEKNHRAILEGELEAVGIRINKEPPQISLRRLKTGGVSVSSTLPLTKLGPDPAKTVYGILHQYKMHNASVLFREDASVDLLIDKIEEEKRKYVRALYVYNKADAVSLEDVDRLARQPHSIVVSAHMQLNLDRLVDAIWDQLALTRVYTKKRGSQPDLNDPVVLSSGRYGVTVEALCRQIHKSLITTFKHANVWGTSALFSPQVVGLGHVLADEDVVAIVTKSNTEQKHDKDYSKRVQEHYDRMRSKKKPLKS